MDSVDNLFGFGVYCRRTGVPLNIRARKDSNGFDNIDDYFPDSGKIAYDLNFHGNVVVGLIPFTESDLLFIKYFYLFRARGREHCPK